MWCGVPRPALQAACSLSAGCHSSAQLLWSPGDPSDALLPVAHAAAWRLWTALLPAVQTETEMQEFLL